MATNASLIWGFFIRAFNGNEYGVAGLMGNLRAESGLLPNNLQNSFNRSWGITDEEYTEQIDNGSYSRSDFQDSAGYGLAQWTYYTRKRNLYDYWKASGKSSIADLEMQCNFLLKELQEDFESVYDTLLNASSISEASDKVLYDFENPKDPNPSTRRSYCQDYYDQFTGTLGDTFEGGGTIDPDIPIDPDDPVDPETPSKRRMSKLLLYASACDLI